MIKAADLLSYLKAKGFRFYSGVPCSVLEGVLEAVFKDKQVRYIPAVRENTALGVASGAYLARKKSCILLQNSGLGNIINALASFNLIYKIPVLMFITWRGYKGKDAPEHIIMGKKTIPLLKELGVPNRVLSRNFRKDIAWAEERMRKEAIPVALIIKEGLLK